MLDDTENYMVSHTELDPGGSSGVVVLDIVPRVSLLAANTHNIIFIKMGELQENETSCFISSFLKCTYILIHFRLN